MARKTINAGGNKWVSIKDANAKKRPQYLAYANAQYKPIKYKNKTNAEAVEVASRSAVRSGQSAINETVKSKSRRRKTY